VRWPPIRWASSRRWSSIARFVAMSSILHNRMC